MIKIQRSSEKAIQEFNDEAWKDANITHYGKPVEWVSKGFVFKATEGEKIVGAIVGKFEAGILYIDDLVVDKDYRGKGVGKLLIGKAEEYGKKMHAHKAHLITGDGWDAEKFYLSCRYKRIAILPKHYLKKDFVIYEKEL